MMNIKSIDEHSTNHADGHKWPRWNFSLLHDRRNV